MDKSNSNALKLTLKLVITKGYGVRATTIEGQNAFAPDSQNTGDQITSDRRSKMRVMKLRSVHSIHC